MRAAPSCGLLIAACLVFGSVACSGAGTGPGAPTAATSPGGGRSPGGLSHTSSAVTTTPNVPMTSPPPTPPAHPSTPVTIAFAGDVHFESFLAPRLIHPKTAMGPLVDALGRADLAIVNLETAVTTRGRPQPKQYTFRAPPAAFTALKDAGIDVATMANNHGLDYGPVSVPDALAAAKAARMPLIGIGENAHAAYRPWIAHVHGQRIAFLAATAVLDAPLVASWSARPAQPGLATALDGNNAALVAAVKAVRPRVDTVVVDLHYGADLTTCPTQIQRKLAHDLVRAGADIVVGQHAHVLVGGGYLGSAYVDYGLGNFEFYVPNNDRAAETGVLVLTVDGRTVTRPRWIPGQIVNGLPTRLTGAPAVQASDRWSSLRGCAGLTSKPR
ncbi:MAG: CapA family protein [Nocardioidaceae bacterium]